MLLDNDQNRKEQNQQLSVRVVRLEDGERFPMLVNTSNGQPMFNPTVYSVAIQRARGLATNTMISSLRAIMHLYQWAGSHQIDIEERIRSGELLSLSDIESLSRAVRLPMQQLEELTDGRGTGHKFRHPVSLEKYRKSAPHIENITLLPHTAAVRIHYIRSYLEWLMNDRLYSTKLNDRSSYETASQKLLQAITARIPTIKSWNGRTGRRGLDPDALSRMLGAIAPDSPENPWSDGDVRIRNYLLITMLLSLGIRRGEALVIRIRNINLQRNTLSIIRSPDDPVDPRLDEPRTKTKSRDLVMSEPLADMVHKYISHIRNRIKNARYHDFLFIAHDSGKPLSLPSVTKIFSTLREQIPELPHDLSSHVMRHTWNDKFSALAEEKGMREEIEKKLRSFLMGWVETSGTAATYTKRYTEKRSAVLSLELQRKIWSKDDDAKT